jgi:hypothetical protein
MIPSSIVRKPWLIGAKPGGRELEAHGATVIRLLGTSSTLLRIADPLGRTIVG